MMYSLQSWAQTPPNLGKWQIMQINTFTRCRKESHISLSHNGMYISIIFFVPTFFPNALQRQKVSGKFPESHLSQESEKCIEALRYWFVAARNAFCSWMGFC